MRLVVLGSSGTWPAPGRPGSGYLLEHGPTRVLLDAGPGVHAALAQRMDPARLDAIVVSHTHADHCTDLFATYHYLAYGPHPPPALPVYLPEGAERHLAGFVRADDPGHEFYAAFSFRTVGEGDVASVGSLRLRFGEVRHSVPGIAVRAEAERSFVYTGDTGLAPGLEELAAGADLLLAEATYQGSDKPWPLHMSAAEAGRLGRAAGVGRLILTHLPPTLDPVKSIEEAEAEFGRPVTVAVPGMEVKV